MPCAKKHAHGIMVLKSGLYPGMQGVTLYER